MPGDYITLGETEEKLLVKGVYGDYKYSLIMPMETFIEIDKLYFGVVKLCFFAVDAVFGSQVSDHSQHPFVVVGYCAPCKTKILLILKKTIL